MVDMFDLREADLAGADLVPGDLARPFSISGNLSYQPRAKGWVMVSTLQANERAVAMKAPFNKILIVEYKCLSLGTDRSILFIMVHADP